MLIATKFPQNIIKTHIIIQKKHVVWILIIIDEIIFWIVSNAYCIYWLYLKVFGSACNIIVQFLGLHSRNSPSMHCKLANMANIWFHLLQKWNSKEQNSCVAAHWSKYHCFKQALSQYDLRCLKATLNPNKQAENTAVCTCKVTGQLSISSSMCRTFSDSLTMKLVSSSNSPPTSYK